MMIDYVSEYNYWFITGHLFLFSPQKLKVTFVSRDIMEPDRKVGNFEPPESRVFDSWSPIFKQLFHSEIAQPNKSVPPPDCYNLDRLQITINEPIKRRREEKKALHRTLQWTVYNSMLATFLIWSLNRRLTVNLFTPSHLFRTWFVFLKDPVRL